MEFCVDILHFNLMKYGSSHCFGAYMCIPIIKCLKQHLFIKIHTWLHVSAMLSSCRFFFKSYYKRAYPEVPRLC